MKNFLMFRIPGFFRMPAVLNGNGILLSQIHIQDAPSLLTSLKRSDVSALHGISQMPFRSWFSFWWWLKKKYCCLYWIILHGRRIGFIGLYDLRPDSSGEISLALFEEHDRRKGYGKKTFFLFKQFIGSIFLKKLVVRVHRDNRSSILFWENLGFIQKVDPHEYVLLSYKLTS